VNFAWNGKIHRLLFVPPQGGRMEINMDATKIHALPTAVFAHSFTSDQYNAHLTGSLSQTEISMVTEGELLLRCNGVEETAKKGDVIFRRDHDMIVNSRGLHTHHTVCFVTEGLPEEMLRFPSVLHPAGSHPRCLRLIDDIIETQLLDQDNFLKLSGLFLQLLGELHAMKQKKTDPTVTGELYYVTRAKEYIYKHISEPILQKSIAAKLGITPEYLCAVFKKNEGRTVMRFINETKLANIKAMISSKQVSLYQAALQYGFSDPNYVSKLYKRYFHETISQAVKRGR
jgi:AraC-like DNA-binding protein